MSHRDSDAFAQAGREAFDQFVRIQNAKDIEAMEALLLDEPHTAWVTGGRTVFGREAITEGLREFYAGTWAIDPAKLEDFRVVFATPDHLQTFAVASLHIGRPGEPPRDVRYNLNLTFVRVGETWKLAALIPIRVPVS